MPFRRLPIVACLLALALLLNPVVSAQESTPPVEPPTAVPPTATFTELPPIPTATETPFPTLTAPPPTDTSLPTETPISTATETPFLTLTPSDAVTVTWTASATETFTPTLFEATEELIQPLEITPTMDRSVLFAQTAGDQEFIVTFDGTPEYLARVVTDLYGNPVQLVSSLSSPGNPDPAAKGTGWVCSGWGGYCMATGLSIPIADTCQVLTSASFDVRTDRELGGVAAYIAVLNTYTTEANGTVLISRSDGAFQYGQTRIWSTFTLRDTPFQLNIPSGSSLYVYGGMGAPQSWLRDVSIDNIRYTCVPTTPTPTATPTNTPTPTPVPWGSNAVPVAFNQELPQFAEPYDPYCPNEGESGYGDVRYRLPCAAIAYNYYRNLVADVGNVMTWGRFVSLVLYGEGDRIMLGYLDAAGQLMYHNPQDTYPNSNCSRWSSTAGDFVSGRDHCEPGVQRHFPWAVAESIFNECAVALGFPRGVYRKVDGTIYDGSCNERGFANFLGQVNSLYVDFAVDGVFNLNTELYLPRAQYELGLWHYEELPYDGQDPRGYGQCPCNWGNVGTEQAAELGLNGQGNSWSYFYNPNEPNPNYVYFTVR